MGKSVNITAALLAVIAIALSGLIVAELSEPGLQFGFGRQWVELLSWHQITATLALFALTFALGMASGARWIAPSVLVLLFAQILALGFVVYVGSSAPLSAVLTDPALYILRYQLWPVWLATEVLPLVLLWIGVAVAVLRSNSGHAQAGLSGVIGLGLLAAVFGLPLAASIWTESSGFLRGTIYRGAVFHLAAFLALHGAMVLAAIALRPRWPVWLSWLAHVILLCAALFWSVVQTQLGRIGMPARYADYPSAFAPLQSVSADVAWVLLALPPLYAAAALIWRGNAAGLKP